MWAKIKGLLSRVRSRKTLPPTSLSVAQVFTPRSLPSVTYVSRDELGLEQAIAKAVNPGSAFIVVTGPTKSGKSVLCTKVLEGRPSITIEGGQIANEEDFWIHIAHYLNVPGTATQTRQQTVTSTATVGGAVGKVGVAQGTGGYSKAAADQKGVGLTYNNVLVIGASRRLSDEKFTVIIDDFHYISEDVQTKIVRSLKGPVFRGLSVLLLAVPHRAFDLVSAEADVESRFLHIEIPAWSLDDLYKIPEAGFRALGVPVSRRIQSRICDNSFGNPLLTQEICGELCAKLGVQGHRSDHAVVDDEKVLDSVYRSLAKDKAGPTLRRLQRGPQDAKSRVTKLNKAGEREGIHSLIITALARLNRESVSYTDLRLSLRALLAPKERMPSKVEIVRSLEQLSVIAKETIVGEPPVEWVADRETFMIIDPFLRFHMTWALRDQGDAGETAPLVVVSS